MFSPVPPLCLGKSSTRLSVQQQRLGNLQRRFHTILLVPLPGRPLRPTEAKGILGKIPEALRPFVGGPHFRAEVGASLSPSEERALTTKDIQKASQLNSGSKREHLNQKGKFQIGKEILETSLQIVPTDIQQALRKLGLDTSVLSRSLPLAGRLQFFQTNWRLLTQDQYILQIVTGVVIPFQQIPLQTNMAPRISDNQSEKEKIEQEIVAMLQKGAIQVVSPMKGEFISLIFLVPKKDGGSRPVINLKRFNSHIVFQHFKMEGLHLLKHIIQEKDFMIKIDLKDAYFCVPMSQQHQPFLRFIWGGTRYQFTCLPLALAPAPLYFTKLLKPVVALLRRLGLRMIVYLDDIIVFNQTREGILRDRDSTLWLLQHLGFLINWKKSVLDPSHCMEYLGFVINSLEMNL